MAVLTPEVRAFLAPGLPGVVSATDAAGRPDTVRVWAARARENTDVLEVYVLATVFPSFFAAVKARGRVAVNLIELPSYRSRTFKGACAVSEAPPDATDLAHRLAALDRMLGSVGMPAQSAEQMLSHYEAPRRMVVLEVQVESVFDQSPKHGAGERL